MRQLESRILRRLLGSQTEEVKEGLKNLISFFCWPNIIGMITLRRMRWAGFVTHTLERRIMWRSLEEGTTRRK